MKYWRNSFEFTSNVEPQNKINYKGLPVIFNVELRN
jgi:hypothetical protein